MQIYKHNNQIRLLCSLTLTLNQRYYNMNKSESTNLNDKQAIAAIDDMRQRLNTMTDRCFFCENYPLKIEFFKGNGKENLRAELILLDEKTGQISGKRFLAAFYSELFTSEQILSIIKTALKSYTSKA